MKINNSVQIIFLSAAWLLSSFSIPLPLAADILFKKDGTIISGSVVRENSDSIVFKEKKQELNIPRTAVKRVIFGIQTIEKVYVYENSGNTLHAYIVDEDSDSITIRNILSSPDEIKIPRKDIRTISKEKLAKLLSYNFIFRSSRKDVMHVSIEGDFTGWQSIPLARAGDLWQIAVEIDILKKNTFEYRYIVNGISLENSIIRFRVEDGKLVEDVDRYKLHLGVSAGYSGYRGGYADRLKIENPSFSVFALNTFPFMPDNFFFQTEIIFLRHSPDRESNIYIRNYNLTTLNFFTGLSLVYRIDITGSFSLWPYAGAGGLYQVTSIDGEETDTVTNSVFTAGYGINISYAAGKSIIPFVSVKDTIQFENSVRTHCLSFMAGMMVYIW
jgi:hypothetical protein